MQNSSLLASQPSRRSGSDSLPIRPRPSLMQRLLHSDRAGLLGLLIFALLVLTAIFAPLLAPHDPLAQNLRAAKLPPAWHADGTWEHPLGTDNLGRDILSRVIYGSRVSMTVGFLGALLAGTLGLLIGLIAGYRGGSTDALIMGVANLILSLPYLVFVVFIAAVLGRSLVNVILIFGLTNIPIFVRLARGETLRLRQALFVEAAQGVGAGNGRILLRHILPNLIGPFITIITFEMSAMIFYEAGLGFLGLSVPPSVPSWGNMLDAGRRYLTIYPWMSVYPGLAIASTGLAMNLLGDWLRDILDPRQRGR